MKILCPVDFSIASIDAVYFAAALLKKFEIKEITILHCSFPGDIAEIFDDAIEKQRKIIQENLKNVMEKMGNLAPEISWDQKLIYGNPLEEISRFIKKNHYDLVIIGTKGLQNPKDRVFGSLTETLFESSKAPILAIPQGYVFHHLNSVVLSIDEENISSEKVLHTFLDLVRKYESNVMLLHVQDEDERDMESNRDLDVFLKGIHYEYYAKTSEESLTKAINEVCQDKSADLLCMIHRDRGWMLNLVHRSLVKEELDQLSMPILILHD